MSKKIGKLVGKNIKKLRIARAWSPALLSFNSRVQEQSIRQYEKGRIPGLRNLTAIADAFGVSISVLVEKTKIKK